MQRFRLDGRSFFLTYPKCALSRDDVLAALKAKLVSSVITNYCISIEAHEDGTPHLHCLIVLEKKKTVASASYFDIGEYHGNYQTARNRVTIFNYITKTDPTPLTNMDAESLKVKSLTRQQVGKRILDGEKVEDLVEEYPHLIFGFKRLQEDIKAYGQARVVHKTLPGWLPNDWGFLMPTTGSEKKRHFWIWSKGPNKGKTTWAKRLMGEYGAHVKGCDFTYWNLHGGEPLIILDDYNTAGLRFNALNQLCDGTYEARIFMGGLRRVEPRLVIVLSNCPIHELYPYKCDLLRARFIEKEL
jgi:hypothetical protein